jgi:hypothetical protein
VSGIAYIAAVAVLSFFVPLLDFFSAIAHVISRGSSKRSSRAEDVSFKTLPSVPEVGASHPIVDR